MIYHTGKHSVADGTGSTAWERRAILPGSCLEPRMVVGDDELEAMKLASKQTRRSTLRDRRFSPLGEISILAKARWAA